MSPWDRVYVWSLEHEGWPLLGYYLRATTDGDGVCYSQIPNAQFRIAPADCVFVGTFEKFNAYCERENANVRSH